MLMLVALIAFCIQACSVQSSGKWKTWKKEVERREEMMHIWCEVAQEDRDKPARPSTNVDECPTEC